MVYAEHGAGHGSHTQAHALSPHLCFEEIREKRKGVELYEYSVIFDNACRTGAHGVIVLSRDIVEANAEAAAPARECPLNTRLTLRDTATIYTPLIRGTKIRNMPRTEEVQWVTALQ